MSVICLFQQSSWGQTLYSKNYLNQKRSLLDINKWSPAEWTDFEKWKKDYFAKLRDPLWEIKKREEVNKERMGRLLSCVGDCRVYRGRAYVLGQHGSLVAEGDDVETFTESYAWIFLFDGTLIRLAPKTSITFREINIGRDKNFIHVRINSGWVQWFSRRPQPHLIAKSKETDSLFLPLKLFDANTPILSLNYPEDQLSQYLDHDPRTAKQFERLNKLKEKNNEWVKNKPTYSFVVFPNGTISGKNLQASFFSMLGAQTYVKIHEHESWYAQEREDSEEVMAYLRGYRNEKTQKLTAGTWYQYDETGRIINDVGEAGNQFALAELLTRRIPTILIARELWLAKFSKLLFDRDIEDSELALKMGYRLWDSTDLTKEGEASEFDQRLTFLQAFTRRTETGLLIAAKKLREKYKADKDTRLVAEFNGEYFFKALDHYLYQLGNYELKFNLGPFERSKLKQRIWFLMNSAGK